MDEFKRYLLSKKIVTKKMPYYLNWITKFHEFCDIKAETPITSENIDRYPNRPGTPGTCQCKNYDGIHSFISKEFNGCKKSS